MDQPRFYRSECERDLYRKNLPKKNNSMIILLVSIFLVLFLAVIYKGIQVNALLDPVSSQAKKQLRSCFNQLNGKVAQEKSCSEDLQYFIEVKNEILSNNYCLLSGARWRLRQFPGSDEIILDTKTFPLCLPWP
ncbi:MAG: hypothetical protein WCT18_02270 [Patescibacteria group bacterium]